MTYPLVCGFVFAALGGPSGVTPGPITTLEFLINGIRYLPYFTTSAHAQRFATYFHDHGIAMDGYRIAHATGLTARDGRLLCDPDAAAFIPAIAGDLRPSRN